MDPSLQVLFDVREDWHARPVDAGSSSFALIHGPARSLRQIAIEKGDDQFMTPVLFDPSTRLRSVPTDQVLLTIPRSRELVDQLTLRGVTDLKWVEGTENSFVGKVNAIDGWHVLNIVHQISKLPGVIDAKPNLLEESSTSLIDSGYWLTTSERMQLEDTDHGLSEWATIDITINGRQIVIPAGIGKSRDDARFRTLNETGRVFIDKGNRSPLTVSDFVSDWGVRFDEIQVFGHCIQSNDDIVAEINGRPENNWDNIPIRSGDRVEIQVSLLSASPPGNAFPTCGVSAAKPVPLLDLDGDAFDQSSYPSLFSFYPIADSSSPTHSYKSIGNAYDATVGAGGMTITSSAGDQSRFYTTLTFVGADANAIVATETKQNDAITEVIYEDIYSGIDLRYHSTGSQLEYDFIVEPGSDPGVIGLQFDASTTVTIDDNGTLVIKATDGEISQHPPVVYQEVAAQIRPIDARFALYEYGIVRFDIGQYDHTLPLVIDPVTGGPDPGLTGPLAVASEDYNAGENAFPIGTMAVEFRGRLYYPSQLAGPYPLIVILHGRHETVNESNDPIWPPEPGQTAIHSYQGYDYLGNLLASHGYMVVSISANGISAGDDSDGQAGMDERATLIDRHLDLINNLNNGSSDSLGGSINTPTRFAGKINMGSIGLMGHSRGGEGIIQAFLNDRTAATPYGIDAVLPLAPTDFFRNIADQVPMGVILPYVDGDVFDLQGIHYFDDARFATAGDTAPKYSWVFDGANHNYFNTIWTFNDSLIAPNGLTQAVQRSAGAAYISAFFRTHLGGETQFEPLLRGDYLAPPSAQTSRIAASYQPPDLAASRRVINDFNNGGRIATNNLGGTVSGESLDRYRICGGPSACLSVTVDTLQNGISGVQNERQQITVGPFVETTFRVAVGLLQTAPIAITASAADVKTALVNLGIAAGDLIVTGPNSGPWVVEFVGNYSQRDIDELLSNHQVQQPHANGLNQVDVTWNTNIAANPAIINNIPNGSRDFRSFTTLQFRTGVNTLDSRNLDGSVPQDRDFSVVLRDGDGVGASFFSVPVSAYGTALEFPDVTGVFLPKTLLQTVRIPLAAFVGINLSNVTSVEFRFDRVGSTFGAILLSDLQLSNPLIGNQIDDDPPSPGFSTTTDDWGYVEETGAVGGHRHYALQTPVGNTTRARWTFSNVPAGEYRVLATWTEGENRPTAAPFTILDGSIPYPKVVINQRNEPDDMYVNGFPYEYLTGKQSVPDTVSISSGRLIVELANVANSDSLNYVVADAIRIERVSDLIMDSSDSGFSIIDVNTTADWGQSTTGGVKGNHLYSPDSTPIPPAKSTKARWAFENMAPGIYRVSASWTGGTDRSTSAPFTILDGSILRTPTPVLRNQENAPDDIYVNGSWYETLTSSVRIASGQLIVELENVANTGLNSYVIADAIHVERVGDLIIDNSDSNNGFAFVGVNTTLAWGTLTGGFKDGLQRYSPVSPAPPPEGATKARWTFDNLATGMYRVSASWTANQNRSQFAPFTILDGSVAYPTALMNQENAPDDFNVNGFGYEYLTGQQSVPYTVSIASGKLIVELANVENPGPNNSNYVVADSIRVERVGDLIIDDQHPGFSLTVPDAWGPAGDPQAVGESRHYPFQTPVGETSKARWSFQNLATGMYRVAASWTAIGAQDTSRSDAAPFTILDGSSFRRRVTMDQEVLPDDVNDNGYWYEYLTTDEGVPITSGQLFVELANVANADGLNYVVADAIRVERVGDVIIDNDDPDNRFSMTPSNWDERSGGVNGHQRRAPQSSTGNNTTARWTFSNLATGMYRVSASWVADLNQSQQAPFKIYDVLVPSGSTYPMNQEIAPNDIYVNGFGYEYVGVGGVPATVRISSGQLIVELADVANSTGTNYVMADAIRVERVGDLIIDNSDLTTGFSMVPSAWGTANGGVNGDQRFVPPGSTTGNTKTARWTFSNLATGMYRVSASWVADPSRSPVAPFRIYDGSVLSGSAIPMDQEKAPNDISVNGFGYEYLAVGGVPATVRISSGQLIVELTDVANPTGDNHVMADAIRVERVGDLIIDDVVASGFSMTVPAAWDTSLDPGAVGESRHYALQSSAGGATAQWTFTNMASGTYRVSASWTGGTSRAQAARFTIYDGTVPYQPVSSDQEVAPDDVNVNGFWYEDLHTSVLISSGQLIVELASLANEDGQNYVIADAIRVERVGSGN